MFGYIKPYKPDLMVKEYEFYKSAYCGLCKNLGKNFGIISRLTLSYDATFLAMFLISIHNNTCPNVHEERCKANPLKKCLFCYENEEIMTFSAAVSVMMMYYKLEDDISDSKFIKKVGYKILRLIGKRPKNKAKKLYPKLDKIVSECVKEQIETEKRVIVSLDEASLPTATMLREILKIHSSDNTTEQRILEQFGYYIGRWIYLADASDDIVKDKKSNSFNPFFKLELGKEYLDNDNEIPSKKLREYCNSVLNQTMAQIVSAFNLLSYHNFDTILVNTIEKGLPNIQKEILFDKYDNKKI